MSSYVSLGFLDSISLLRCQIESWHRFVFVYFAIPHWYDSPIVRYSSLCSANIHHPAQNLNHIQIKRLRYKTVVWVQCASEIHVKCQPVFTTKEVNQYFWSIWCWLACIENCWQTATGMDGQLPEDLRLAAAGTAFGTALSGSLRLSNGCNDMNAIWWATTPEL